MAIALSLSYSEAKASNSNEDQTRRDQIRRDEALAREVANSERDGDGKSKTEKISQSDADFALMLQMSEQQEEDARKTDHDRDLRIADSKTLANDERVALALQQKLDREAIAKDAGDERGGGGGGGIMDSLMNKFRGMDSGSSSALLKKCFRCGSVPLNGVMVTTRGRAYCPGCMRCKICSNTLTSQVYHHPSDADGLYCYDCLEETHGTRCSVCRTFLRGQYLRHNFFESEKYCLTHEQIENRRKCTSCHRIEPMPDPSSGRGPFVDLPDGRPVCLECLDSAVMTTDEMAALYVSVIDFMEGALGLSIPSGMRQVPVLAVDAASLNSEMDRGSLTHSGPGSQQVQVRGLTLSRSGQLKHYSAGDLSFSWERGWQMGPGRVHKVETVREVTAVLVLYGLPRDLTASILAHEATHVYLRLCKDVPVDLALPSEEGLCQVVAHRFLQHLHGESAASAGGGGGGGPSGRVRTGGFDFHRPSFSPFSSRSSKPAAGISGGHADTASPSPSPSTAATGPANPAQHLEAKLRRYFMHSIEHDPSPVYGDGFRHAKRVVDALGLEIALDELRHRRALPEGV